MPHGQFPLWVRNHGGVRVPFFQWKFAGYARDSWYDPKTHPGRMYSSTQGILPHSNTYEWKRWAFKVSLVLVSVMAWLFVFSPRSASRVYASHSLVVTSRYAIHVAILSGFAHTLERLWMTVHPQILLAFLTALSRTRKIHLSMCSWIPVRLAWFTAASNGIQPFPNFQTWKIGCTICVHWGFMPSKNMSLPCS